MSQVAALSRDVLDGAHPVRHDSPPGGGGRQRPAAEQLSGLPSPANGLERELVAASVADTCLRVLALKSDQLHGDEQGYALDGQRPHRVAPWGCRVQPALACRTLQARALRSHSATNQIQWSRKVNLLYRSYCLRSFARRLARRSEITGPRVMFADVKVRPRCPGRMLR